MKKDRNVKIVGLDAVAWTLIRRPGRTARAEPTRSLLKFEERLQGLGYLE
jgi:hypothetical protein